MVLFHAWWNKACDTLKYTAQSIEASINWLRPWGIKKQFSDISVRCFSYRLKQECQVYGRVEELENKIHTLESNRDAHATNYGLIRSGLAFMVAPGITQLYHAALFFDRKIEQEHFVCYLSAVILAYVTGTILGKTAKTKFENDVREDLTLFISNYRQASSDDDDEEEDGYLTQPYKPQEYHTIPEQSKPAIRPLINGRKENKYEQVPFSNEPLTFDFEKFYAQYCQEFQPPQDPSAP